MKIVYLDTYPLGDIPLEPITSLGDYTGYDHTRPEQVIERSRQTDILIVNKVNLPRQVIEALPGLRLICVSATGMNNVDTEFAASKGIPVRNVAGYSTSSVTEAVLGMVFTLLRNIPYYDRYVKD
ncbi:MAG: hydroxyacid dehydrogenase, partial [Rikenellaceae bacterium]|nr:hydroxyacid dehydrogenase [Rikenellaceae bacterium]